VTLRFTHSDGLVLRVGYSPDPWAWAPWEYAPFTGRWDDPDALFRTIYAASSAEACFIEVLAQFRPDPGLDSDLASIAGCRDDVDYEGSPPGVVGRNWLWDPGCPTSTRRRFASMRRASSLSRSPDTCMAGRPRMVDSRQVLPSGQGTVTTCGCGHFSNEKPTSAGTAVISCGTAATSR